MHDSHTVEPSLACNLGSVEEFMAFQLVCPRCQMRHDGSVYRLFCDRCASLLDIEYDRALEPKSVAVLGAPALLRYSAKLPIGDPSRFVTLGEGNTPIVQLDSLGRQLGLEHLFAKLEYFSPTGSFKDRGNAIQVTVLKELGIAAAADIAGGNAGHSFASYCARAGIKFIGFAYEDPQHPKLQAIALTGAEMHWVNGDRRACHEAMAKYCADNGILNMRYGQNAYFIEGQKTIAYEIVEQTGSLLDHIIVPVGNGSILLGLWKGFKEMAEDGRIRSIPRLHAAQSEAFQPVVAVLEGRDWSPDPHADSVAVGIKIAEPPRLAEVTRACHESGGKAVAVSEDAIVHWHRRLDASEGLFVEPTSATVLAAAETLIRQGVIDTNERVLTILTGFGFKESIPEYPAAPFSR
jgi:threonine synthase